MRLIREHDVLVYDEFTDYNFIDSADVTFSPYVLPLTSLWNAIQAFFVRKKCLNQNTHISMELRDMFVKKKRIIEITSLDGFEKYNCDTLCPIEYVIAKFCNYIHKNIDAWMFVIRRSDYTVKIVSGINDSVLNSRKVVALNNEQIIYELDRTRQFINRTVLFEDIDIITNIAIPHDGQLKIHNFDADDGWEVLLRFADKFNVYSSFFGKKRFYFPKCNRYLLMILLIITASVTYVEYQEARRLQNKYEEITMAVNSHRNNFHTKFGENSKIEDCRDFFQQIKALRYPLKGLKNLSKAIDKGMIQKITWEQDKIKIQGSNFSDSEIKNMHGVLVVPKSKEVDKIFTKTKQMQQNIQSILVEL